jgi:hypothetical protein
MEAVADLQRRVALLERALARIEASLSVSKSDSSPQLDLQSQEGLHLLRKELDAVRSNLLPGLPVKQTSP